jgi:DNA-binding protein HU-beta
MNKMELISTVATKANLTQKDTTKAVNAVFETIVAEQAEIPKQVKQCRFRLQK